MNLHTLLRGKTALAMALCAATCSQFSSAQVAPPVILQIDLTNNVLYIQDTSDIFKYATEPNVTTPLTASLRNFYRAEGIADIVAVNGQPMKGTYANAAAAMALRTAPTPGQAIADMVRQAITVTTFEILKSDGTSIGTIVASGLFFGDAPPGSPTAATGNNYVITGGTGAFLGARGQMSIAAAAPGVVTQRSASITEDPANRHRNGGGTVRWIAHVIPMARPEVTMLPAGPAITHSSGFSLVTASKPATQGEILSLFATGLGPVTPRVDPGQPFPSSPMAVVNSPVEVTVNGKPADLIGAAGYPGSVDSYQVNFRLPPDTARGPARIQVTAAWISGAPVSIPVQ
jgi:uncharacterized protein (TIGR03437 family)